MKDGFYLSTYLHYDALSNAIRYSHRHDQNISLWYKEANNIKLLHYWELERVTGLKQFNISVQSIEHLKILINYLLKQYDLSISDIIEVWGTPGLDTCESYHSLNEYPNLPFHTIAHLFSSILFDSNKFYNEVIIAFAFDGGPDRIIDHDKIFDNNFAGCLVNKGNIIDVFPTDSPGKLWFDASDYYNIREGTLMALGSASKSQLLNINIDSIFSANKNYYEVASKFLYNIILKLNNIKPEDAGIIFDQLDKRFSLEENKISMYVKILQKVSIKMVEDILEDVCRKYNLDTKRVYLALSGGYALNCPTNSHLMNKYHFKGFIAPPCVNDSGISLGIALYAFYKKINTKIEFSMKHAYYGDRSNDMSILSSNKYSKFVKIINEFDKNQFVNDLENHPIIWFNGRSEVGPRALGNRSILGDPRNKKAKNIINALKQREWWRPVAPIILEEDIGEWFENPFSSPFMLHTLRVKKQKINLIPAVTHLDNTARVQTISSIENPILYKAIKTFKDITGVPIVANSSLNDKGEPIINTIEEMLNFALRKKIKIVYIKGKRVELVNHDKYTIEKPLKRVINILEFEKSQSAILDELNPYKVSEEHLKVYCRLPLLKSRYNLQDKNDAKAFSDIAQIILNKEREIDGSMHNRYLKAYNDIVKII